MTDTPSEQATADNASTPPLTDGLSQWFLHERRCIEAARAKRAASTEPPCRKQPSEPVLATPAELSTDTKLSSDTKLDSETAIPPKAEPAAAPASLSDDCYTGLAISGGGVRSATFALGVVGRLASGSQPALSQVDYLSTVSGGGYFGAFLGSLIQRYGLSRAYALLQNPQSAAVLYLKRNGRYLAASGDEAAHAATVIIRNLAWLHLRLALLMFPLFVLLYLLVSGPNAPWCSHNYRMDDWYWVLATPTLGCFAVAALLGCSYFLGNWGKADGKKRRLRTSQMVPFVVAGAGFALVIGGAYGMQLLLSDALLQRDASLTNNLLAAYSVLVLASGGVYRFFRTVQPLLGGLVKFSFSITTAAVLLLLGYLAIGFGLSMIAVIQLYYNNPAQFVWWVSACVLVPPLVGFALNLLSQSLNFTSLHYFYKFRLRRAFLAASNPTRFASTDTDVQQQMKRADWLDDDEVSDLRQYQPTAQGGPLHLINITINNSFAVKQGLWLPDCKGKNLAVSGLGYNYDETALSWQQSCREPLELSGAVAISGAAASTGMGQLSSFATSLLTGLFNVRTGFWWMACANSADSMRYESFYRLFLREISNHFTAEPHAPWYLSDGGHFENLAVYELVRRRVDRIVVLDGGQDVASTFEDLGNLIRRVRLDFSCELTWLATAPAELAALQPLLGSPEQLTPNEHGICQRRVMLYQVNYPANSWYAPGQPAKTGYLLYVKPLMLGHEPLDLQHYRCKHPDFPHQSTADQFFDEAQWESYRKLGALIGDEIADAVGQFYRGCHVTPTPSQDASASESPLHANTCQPPQGASDENAIV